MSKRFRVIPWMAALVALAVAGVSVAAIDQVRMCDQLARDKAANVQRIERLQALTRMRDLSRRAYLLTRDSSYYAEAQKQEIIIQALLDTVIRSQETPEGAALARQTADLQARHDYFLEMAIRDIRVTPVAPDSRPARLVKEFMPLRAELDSSFIRLGAVEDSEYVAARLEASQAASRGMAQVALTCGLGLLTTGGLAAIFRFRLNRAREDQARLRASLRETEERYRDQVDLMATLAGNASVALIFQDAEARVTYMNPAAEALTGYSLAELAGRNIHQALHAYRPDGSPNPAGECPIIRAAREGRRITGQDYLLRKDGGWVPIAFTSTPMPPNGPAGVIVEVEDITQRKEAEEALRRFHLMAEESDNFIALIGLDGTCRFLNAGARKLTGRGAEESPLPEEQPSRQGAFIDYLIEEDREEALRTLGRIMEDGPWHGEFRLRHLPTGRAIPMLWNIFPLRQPGVLEPFALGAVGQDLTAMREREEQIRQGQKLESIGKLAGGIAHDFNNILTVINGYGDLLFQRLPPDDPNRQMVSVILESGRRAATLTGQLLAYARKQVLQPRSLDLNEAVTEMAGMLRRVLGEHIELKLQTARRLNRVKADPAQVNQILLNLCLNARDAMPRGGLLILSTGNASLESGLRNRYGSLPPGNYAFLAVTDTGHGMTQNVMERLFEPFFTTKTGHGAANRVGTGLGLSSVHGIIRQSGGAVEVSSRPGEGSTFRVYLPVDSRKEAGPDAESPEVPGGSGARAASRERILLVEDEAPVRQITRTLLESGGYEVVEARDGLDALAVLESLDRPPDLILSDSVMPRMGGRQLAREVLARWPDRKFLFTSGYSEEAVPGSEVQKEGFPFLQKPFTIQTLLKAVQEALAAQPVRGGA